ncbi:hypothetical protein T11_7991 [Trichinella zimbabwensis]|uniref:Uncharacterized protein n=1 Tax=Trichinella zimbabwensis TaxID=268475 RepID=A0A0V1F3S2_9BILA|nr:hypothetical protein T11_7991 [Trichinella zimbabwensis]
MCPVMQAQWSVSLLHSTPCFLLNFDMYRGLYNGTLVLVTYSLFSP